jgi:hypothetical protein
MRWDELSPAGSSGFSQRWLNRLGRGARPDHSCKRSDRGRDDGIKVAPPSEPDRRFSRIRLSS